MEQIGRTYGKFILEGIVLICLVGIFIFGKRDDSEDVGILELLGNNLSKVNETYESYMDFKGSYKEESGKEAPVIRYVAGAVDAGVVNLAQLIKAIDYAGNELEVEILSIRNMDDVELIESYDPDAKKVEFVKAGIYTVRVRARDDGNRTKTCRIKIPVNNRRVMEVGE